MTTDKSRIMSQCTRCMEVGMYRFGKLLLTFILLIYVASAVYFLSHLLNKVVGPTVVELVIIVAIQ